MALQTTGLFTAGYHKINLQRSTNHLYLVPFGDIHYGAVHHAAKHFSAFIREYRTKPYVRYLGMGDYFDFGSTSERLKIEEVHDSTKDRLDQMVQQDIRDFVKKYPHLIDHTLGLIEGNHYYQFRNGTTSTQYLAQLLHCNYLGAMALMRLNITIQTVCFTYDICAFHGRGAATLFGGSINRVLRMTDCANADLYLQGHDHHLGTTSKTQIYLNILTKTQEPIIKERIQHFCRTGSFLKGYIQGRSSYVADRGASARTLGGVVIEIAIRSLHRNSRQLTQKIHECTYEDLE